jgi:hypothetical protein
MPRQKESMTMAELMMQFLLGYPSKHKMGPAKTILDKNKLICKNYSTLQKQASF